MLLACSTDHRTHDGEAAGLGHVSGTEALEGLVKIAGRRAGVRVELGVGWAARVRFERATYCLGGRLASSRILRMPRSLANRMPRESP